MGIFFATSHGKQPCDGIGGTVKQLVSHASLKCDLKDQILSPSDMFQFCKETIQNIQKILRGNMNSRHKIIS